MINLNGLIDKYDVIFLDVDNTLFNYTFAHDKALNSVLTRFSFSKEDYAKARREIKKRELEVNHHRKELNFKVMCEMKNIHFSQTLQMYSHYEDIFHANMHIDRSMLDMMTYAKSANRQIVAITNFYTLPQIKKLEIIGMSDLIDWLVTSEEFECEKPDSKLFDHALKLVGSPDKSRVVMFGDSMADDTAHLGIDYFPYNCTKLLISVSGKSGAGKTTLNEVLSEVWGCSVIEADGYHKFERGHEHWKTLTHYHPKSNNLIQLGLDIKNLYHGISDAKIPTYNHSTGKFDFPIIMKHDELDVVVIDGLHSLYKEVTGNFVKIRIFLDNELADSQKIARDSEHRSKTEEAVRKSIDERSADYDKFIAVQKQFANFYIHVSADRKFTITVNEELKFKKFLPVDGKVSISGEYSDMLHAVKSLMLDLKENRYV